MNEQPITNGNGPDLEFDESIRVDAPVFTGPVGRVTLHHKTAGRTRFSILSEDNVLLLVDVVEDDQDPLADNIVNSDEGFRLIFSFQTTPGAKTGRLNGDRARKYAKEVRALQDAVKAAMKLFCVTFTE